MKNYLQLKNFFIFGAIYIIALVVNRNYVLVDLRNASAFGMYQEIWLRLILSTLILTILFTILAVYLPTFTSKTVTFKSVRSKSYNILVTLILFLLSWAALVGFYLLNLDKYSTNHSIYYPLIGCIPLLIIAVNGMSIKVRFLMSQTRATK